MSSSLYFYVFRISIHNIHPTQKEETKEEKKDENTEPNKIPDSPYWECTSCTFVNSKMSTNCKICSEPRPQPQPDADDAGSEEKKDEGTKCVVCNAGSEETEIAEFPCGHNVCWQCAKKYILNGIATMKWKKQRMVCPHPSGCDEIYPYWGLSHCGLGVGMTMKLEQMITQYIVNEVNNKFVDPDQDVILSRFKEVIGEIGTNISPKQATQIFEQLDESNNGSIKGSMLTANNFLATTIMVQ